MSYFEIDDDELNFFLGELEYLIRNPELNSQIKHLTSFREDMIRLKVFNETDYLNLARNSILSLVSRPERDLKSILDLSRISSSVRDIYEELDLEKALISFLGETEYKGTDYNYVIISDYRYSYFYWNCVKLLDNKGIKYLINYFETNKILLQSNPEIMINTIVTAFLNEERFSKSDLLALTEKENLILSQNTISKIQKLSDPNNARL